MRLVPLRRTMHANVAYYPHPLRWWHFRERADLRSIFGGEDVMITHNPKFLDLLVLMGAFENNAVARNAGYTNKMPGGYSETIFSRHATEKRQGFYSAIYLWNPINYEHVKAPAGGTVSSQETA